MVNDPTCAICGQGGYWVGWSARYDEYRCVNHIHTPMPEEVSDE